MKIKNYLPLILILILGGFLRFFQLDKFPVSPNWDEVSHGYNAYSILKTGMDEWGRAFPLIFRAFGDYKLPLYIYLTIVPVWLFGLNVFAIRFISALSGTLAILGLYLLAKELFTDKKLALLSAFLLAISPWHFFISRPALEANLALTLIIFGLYYLLRFFKASASLIPAVLFLGLSLHAYNTARVFVPLIVVFSWIIYKPKLKFDLSLLISGLMTVIFAGLVIFQVYVGEGTARYEKLKILSPTAVFQLGEKRATSKLPPLIAKLLINRPVYFLTTVGKSYVNYFSPAFFNQSRGAQYQFAIPGQNLLTLPVFIFAFFGFFLFLPRIKNRENFQFLYLALLLSPFAASLTIDPPQALRPNPMIPVLIIFAGLGFSRLLALVPFAGKKLFSAIIFFWLIISFAFYLQDYTGSYKIKYSDSWQFGFAEAMNYVHLHQAEYDRVFITKRYGESHIFYAFFTKLSPVAIQPGHDNIRYKKSDWFWTDRIGQVYFINDWDIPTGEAKTLSLESGPQVSAHHSLLITSPLRVPTNAVLLKTINYLDGSPAFIIATVP